MRWPAPLRASALKEQISLKEYTSDRVFLKMSYHPCVSGCGRSLAPQDGHDHCLTCLGIQHAEEAFVDGSCSSCGDMTISELRNRLRCVKHGGVPLPRSGVRPGTKRGGTASGGVRGDLRITVRASPSGGSHPSGTPQPAGDLQAFSVDDSCLQFGPADSSATLRPRPGYVPKVPTTPFRDQVVNLQALPPEEADPALALLCPVRALRQYTDRTQSFRTSEQLFVCYGGQQKGKAVSKQRMAHWIVDAITLAYEAQGVPCPLRLRAHSTRGVASSWTLARGASLADICRAAGWATPNTFARFYSLRVEPVSSCVLTSNG